MSALTSRRHRRSRAAPKARIDEVVKTRYPDGEVRVRVHIIRPGGRREVLEGHPHAKAVARGMKEARRQKAPFVGPIPATTAYDPSRRCPVGMVVQSLMFDKKHWHIQSVSRWMAKEGYRAIKGAHYTDRYIHLRLRNPHVFDKDSIRTIVFGKGIKAIVGCPRGAKRGRHVH
jgi:hypothetical protein